MLPAGPPTASVRITRGSTSSLSDHPGGGWALTAHGSCGQNGSLSLPPTGTELFPSGTKRYLVIIEGLSPGTHTIYTQHTTIAPDIGCPAAPPRPINVPGAHTEMMLMGP